MAKNKIIISEKLEYVTPNIEIMNIELYQHILTNSVELPDFTDGGEAW